MNLEDRLDLYQNMILSCHNIYFWTYDSQMTLLESNCPTASAVSALFSMGDTMRILQSYSASHRKPIVMTNNMSMTWVAVPGWEDNELTRVYALGPFFVDSVSPEDLTASLKKLKLSPELTRSSAAFLKDLPVVSLNRAFEYTLMLYYCIYEQTISISDLHYQENERTNTVGRHSSVKKDMHGTYEMEQQMVRMVREGNLDYKRHMNRIAMTGTMGQLSQSGDQMRQMKNAVLVCIVLFSRAAIEGGLAPEISMTLTDHYFQSVEACKGLPELTEIAMTMQDDFVQRVHKCRNSALSKPVQECCDYIDLHMEESFTLGDMAEKLRYSEVYLCRKFKEETGKTFRDYVRSRKLERARDMMADNSLPIKEISERLGFCSLSYFGKSFKDAYGMSPSEWRQKKA
jgi:AraC-like DNA-binding protein